MDEITTTNFSKFGARERGMMIDILNAWEKTGLPADFYEDTVSIMLNINSRYVSLTNEEYQVAMVNNGKLESFYSCRDCGTEGFLEELAESTYDCCKKYVEKIKENLK